MSPKIGVFVVLALCLLIKRSTAQECVSADGSTSLGGQLSGYGRGNSGTSIYTLRASAAESVVNLKLEANHILSWSLRLGEPCEVSEYLINIFHPGQPSEHTFTVKERSVDVSFLKVCEEWIFVVVPISGHTMGGQRRLTAKLPLPPDANLYVAYMNVFYNPLTEITRLYWDMADSRLGNCSLRYRVTIEQEGSPVIEDFYVDDLYIDLSFLSSCTSYQFGVRAINVASPTIEGPLASAVLELPGRRPYPPFLLNSTVGATWINMWFRLESEVRNPCPFKELHIGSGSSVSESIDLSNDVERLPVNVTLTNLEPSTTYILSTYVTSAAGQSLSAVVVLTTKDVDPDVEGEVQTATIK